MSLHLNDITDKKMIVQALNSEETAYHTHTDVAEKSHAFVLRGLEQARLDLTTGWMMVRPRRILTFYLIRGKYVPTLSVIRDNITV